MTLNTDTIASGSGRMENTRRISWMANNAIPDSIIMNKTCRSLLPPAEARPTEVLAALTSKNTLRILNTIKLVTRAFTAMDAVRLVIIIAFPQTAVEKWPRLIVVAPIVPSSHKARGDKLKLNYKNEDRTTESDWPMYVIAKNEGMIVTRISLPHTIQQR